MKPTLIKPSKTWRKEKKESWWCRWNLLQYLNPWDFITLRSSKSPAIHNMSGIQTASQKIPHNMGQCVSYRYIYNHITLIIFLKENEVYQGIDVLQETFSHKLNGTFYPSGICLNINNDCIIKQCSRNVVQNIWSKFFHNTFLIFNYMYWHYRCMFKELVPFLKKYWCFNQSILLPVLDDERPIIDVDKTEKLNHSVMCIYKHEDLENLSFYNNTMYTVHNV